MPKKKGSAPKAKKAKPKTKARSTPHAPSKAERRRWQAEGLVEGAMKDSPDFKKEVRRIERELTKLEKSVEVEPK